MRVRRGPATDNGHNIEITKIKKENGKEPITKIIQEVQK